MKIRKAIIPAAGLGTRFLPVCIRKCCQSLTSQRFNSSSKRQKLQGSKTFWSLLAKLSAQLRTILTQTQSLNKTWEQLAKLNCLSWRKTSPTSGLTCTTRVNHILPAWATLFIAPAALSVKSLLSLCSAMIWWMTRLLWPSSWSMSTTRRTPQRCRDEGATQGSIQVWCD